MNLKKFRIVCLVVASMVAIGILPSCSAEEGEVSSLLPMEFKSTEYTIRTNIASLITFEHGSGKFQLEVNDSNIIGYSFITPIGRHIYVCPVRTGDCTIKIKDRVTKQETELDIKVTELFFEFFVDKMSDNIRNPGLEPGDELRFIYTEDRRRVVEIRRNDEVIRRGLFDVIYGKEFKMEFYFWDDPEHPSYQEPDHTYSYLMDSSTLSVYILFYRGFGFRWEGFIDCRGVEHPGAIKLRLVDPETNKFITADAQLQLTF